MEKRKITFVTGNIATYHLSAGKLSQLMFFYPKDSCEISETVYHVESLDSLKEEYDKLNLPTNGEKVSEICFFEGDCYTAPLSDYELEIKLDRVKRQFSCSKIAKDVYKVTEL